MCGLYGMFDTKNFFNPKERVQIIRALACASEVRGTDAAGIAYVNKGEIQIKKRPCPAHKLSLKLPASANAVIGHTRMTTQGNELFNFNNHPFTGKTGSHTFALAHNGMIHNDFELRQQHKLPHSKIQTDSYVITQLIEREKQLNHAALKNVAEVLDGTFSFTVLDNQNRIYFIKGNNPIYLCHFPALGLYLYASTESIFKDAIKSLPFLSSAYDEIKLSDGEILSLDISGNITRSKFNTDKLHSKFADFECYIPLSPYSYEYHSEKDGTFIDSLKSVAPHFGYTREDIDLFLSEGFDPWEIEELLYGIC